MNSGRIRIGFGGEILPSETLRILLDNPEALLDDRKSETVKAGRTSLVVRTSVVGKDGPFSVAFKRIKRKTLWKRMTSFVETNRAWRNWRIAHWCLEHGISTPCPVAAIVPRRHLASANCYLVTKWIDHAKDLHDYLQDYEKQDCEKKFSEKTTTSLREFTIALGKLLGKMHKFGLSHRDLKAGNFLVVEQPLPSQLYLIDLDGAKIHQRLNIARKVRNLSRLGLAVSPFRVLTASRYLRFLKTYLATSEIPVDEWKKWWREISADILRRSTQKRKRAA